MAGQFRLIAQELGELVEEKNQAYGSATQTSAQALALLWPAGIPRAAYDDALLMTRVWDKLSRIANRKDAFGESPWKDIAGYGLLGAAKDDPRFRGPDSVKAFTGTITVNWDALVKEARGQGKQAQGAFTPCAKLTAEEGGPCMRPDSHPGACLDRTGRLHRIRPVAEQRNTEVAPLPSAPPAEPAPAPAAPSLAAVPSETGQLVLGGTPAPAEPAKLERKLSAAQRLWAWMREERTKSFPPGTYTDEGMVSPAHWQKVMGDVIAELGAEDEARRMWKAYLQDDWARKLSPPCTLNAFSRQVRARLKSELQTGKKTLPPEMLPVSELVGPCEVCGTHVTTKAYGMCGGCFWEANKLTQSEGWSLWKTKDPKTKQKELIERMKLARANNTQPQPVVQPNQGERCAHCRDLHNPLALEPETRLCRVCRNLKQRVGDPPDQLALEAFEQRKGCERSGCGHSLVEHEKGQKDGQIEYGPCKAAGCSCEVPFWQEAEEEARLDAELEVINQQATELAKNILRDRQNGIEPPTRIPLVVQRTCAIEACSNIEESNLYGVPVCNKHMDEMRESGLRQADWLATKGITQAPDTTPATA